MAMSGARIGGMYRLHRLVAVALARDLTVFVVPGPEIARAHNLDLIAAGLRPVPTPRQAGVLLVVGDLPTNLARAAAVAYAQMPRPRAILAVGAGGIAPLPDPDIAVSLDQRALERAVGALRRIIADGAFSPTAPTFDAAAVRTETEYTCPMHPEIVRDGPGKCPLCGMDLVPRERLGESTGYDALAMEHEMSTAGDVADGMYTCPMHPEIVRDTPGSCPLCGMDLVPRAAMPAGATHDDAPGEGAGSDAAGYRCPMHPAITRGAPGACPICGMALVRRESQGDEGSARAASTGTGGYTCPMHPEIVRDESGACPLCGMALVPREEPVSGPDRDAAEATVGAPTTGASHTAHDTADHGAKKVQESHTAEPPQAHGQQQGQGQPPTRVTPPDRLAGGERDAQHADMAQVGQATDDPGHHGHGTSPTVGHPEGNGVEDGHHGGVETPTAFETIPADHAATDYDSHSMPGATTGALATGDLGHGGHGGDAMGEAEQALAGMGHGGHDMGDMDHGMDMAGGFMSMVAMTRDLPRSRDGLPMEWLEVPFGPLFPGLPGGLALTLTLDGDVVAQARLFAGAVSRGLAATFPGPATTFPARLARLDPFAPFAYCLLAWRALESAAGVVGDERVARARAGTLERERAVSHLGWLASFAALLGDHRLAERAAAMQLALLRATDPATLARLRDEARRLADRTARDPFLRRRLRGIGRVAEATTVERRGPVARAGGIPTDARADDPAYLALGFAPVTRTGADALASLHVRLAEVAQSLELVLAAGVTDTILAATLSGDTAGRGSATVETPRGAATLHLLLDGGSVREAHLDTPSTAHGELVAAATAGRELADALVGVAALDLSPWELDR